MNTTLPPPLHIHSRPPCWKSCFMWLYLWLIYSVFFEKYLENTLARADARLVNRRYHQICKRVKNMTQKLSKLWLENGYFIIFKYVLFCNYLENYDVSEALTTQSEHEVQSCLLLYIEIWQCASVFQLFTCEYAKYPAFQRGSRLYLAISSKLIRLLHRAAVQSLKGHPILS